MKRLIAFSFLLWSAPYAMAQQMVSTRQQPGAFTISAANMPAIYTDAQDDWLVQKAASLLQQDIEQVTGTKPELVHSRTTVKNLIIIGTVTGCKALQQLHAQKQVEFTDLKGQWEAFRVQAIPGAGKGSNATLVIAGSDKRGAAYGVFELSRQLGLSPWYWWADAPVQKKTAAYIPKGIYQFPSPSVKYRGIFINDEAPAFSGWTREKFGGVNHLVYEKMFELLLRLKGNYLWPAMWGNAFNDDDTLNPILADKWGIVMGTSHHEPMQRSQQEWKRYGKGEWDYTKNEAGLKQFWTKGIANMGTHESIVTLGMRGDGDMPMTKGTATQLLEKIVTDQRNIITTVTGKPATQTPQLWALYKEVQDYYDEGMRVPDDVTLLLCDDNWGNIRRLPKPGEPKRAGGYGIYYHFDYVGGPRNYKWLNTNNISRVWEQMHLAYAHGVDQIWIVNVGDLKPMELPISFFLDYAYNTHRWNEDNIEQFYTQWATEQFGHAKAPAIAAILKTYAHYASRRKPELLDASTYSLTVRNEFAQVVQEWTTLRQQAEAINNSLTAADKDAYFQLVLHPIQALENLHQLYYAVAMNKQLATQKNILANQWAEKAKAFYLADSLISVKYNKEIAGGKWNHMMDQTHIGYRSWQEPRRNIMPALDDVAPDSAIATTAVLKTQPLYTPPAAPTEKAVYVEKDGYTAMSATRYTRAVTGNNVEWKTIPGIGKNGDGITTFPVTTSVNLSATSPHLEYDIYTTGKDSVTLRTWFSPTLNIHHAPTGLRFAVSIDDEAPQLLGLNKEDNTGIWNAWVANNNIVKQSRHYLAAPGKHIVRYWMLDAGVVLQKLVVETAGRTEGYLPPPDTLSDK
ncbi:Glycosyl hydrolase family 67 N-terminus [Filimonas lacunae]|uniref:Glycosyl hydrolase family 67 N-terminus n=1 Tax=Filimonas lacunae TaxID=477680 RepID=A0A173MGR4_9BACT|nr:glycosyl hydrolase 115 family protein [Filimonas lacunae]BAV06814.1 hypothetical protein FLA_2834 [Filimonas lacunae]SIS99357.1 Glycosyl hydrolase family 67 N-terminus [Filimonas lacunae]